MSISSNLDYSYSPTALITSAYELLNVNLTNEDQNNTLFNMGLVTLNVMQKAFITQGLQMWKRTTCVFTLVQGQKNYIFSDASAPFEPVKLESVQLYKTSDDSKTQLTPVNWNEFTLPNNLIEGVPELYLFYPALPPGLVAIYPTPDADTASNYQLVCSIFSKIANVTIDDDLDFPEWWYETLVYNLAYRLGPRIGVKKEVMDSLKEMAFYTLDQATGYQNVQDGPVYYERELE